ncbi:glycosyltransferase [Clostridium perfringens]|uniref:glycosyltransferase family 2 protein n=1 Tax=Clostridium perfringens TaxID=1502 RepID=UPI001A2F3B3B|nr:glycosyltransferase family 2 protein [Clostridium perfringens]MDK0893273.1 glycosyltransferase family 2 protein [Clostridium perfringens]MDT7984936.1 glycosyltransferase family 2 protein [Clostridium perfringens]MDT8040351.1 glycosyltransferase family 2 protein [Clostridium perfringens]MDZ5037222.1 glycosyltransferase [Clostridium perfringens]HAT4169015.1 glycosyltransferase [Clostridium perfringens]
MNKKLRFSIITVCYNSSNTIEKTIESIKKQRKDLFEYIVIDGLSLDNTLEKVNQLNNIVNLKIISEKDTGIYNAMNKGLKIANGEWIIFINSDDWLEDNILDLIEKKYKNYLDDEKISAIYGDINKVDETGKYIRSEKPSSSIEKNINVGMPIFHQAVFIRNEVYKDFGGFDESFKIAGDWDFISRMYNKNLNFKYIPRIISNFRVGGASINQHILERHRVRSKNNLYKVFDFKMIIEYLVYLKKKRGI